MQSEQIQAHSQKKILNCKDIIVKFGEFTALNKFSFHIDRKEIHFLIGPNGAGKTTFLDVLCGLTKITKGKAVFDNDYDLNGKPEFEIARMGIGRKFQAPTIFPYLTVQENLEIAMKQNKKVFSILKAKMTKKEKEKLDKQMETIGLTKQKTLIAGNLSHGQKQWLEIGMVMMQEPELLLLDEPIAGMTEEEEEKTGKLLQELKKQCTIIVVEHDMDFVSKYAERVTVMHEGALLSEGSMEEVQNNDKVKEVYLGSKGAV
ncbi:urea ABC transporter ATP-binding protein UrtD [Marinococcus halotolerans]|uniref:urea ABC transporter ATP-binding protein UrtD n=1 Tax=Marinococcus halotolerans TaxID=301092 RepID=UPI0003B4C72B|nr:urea ABC transporter ATP-binding protein UrtD [Marinococcus halotolerans]